MSSLNGQPKQVPLANSPNPVGGRGPGHLAVPSPLPATDPNADVENKIYESWLYAAVANPDGTLAGLFMTKDGGATWTADPDPDLSHQPDHAPRHVPSRPTTTTQPNYDVISSPAFPQGNYTLSLAVDPLNPSVVYFGGTSDRPEPRA